MTIGPRSARYVLALVAAALLAGATAWRLSIAVAGARSADEQTAGAAGAGAATREDAYRANNAGVTRLEQFDFPAAVAAFRQALTLDPSLSLARLNLGIALFYAGDLPAAEAELIAARAALPERPHVDYVLGLIMRATDRPAEAIAAFARVQGRDPDDSGAAINLGQLHTQERRYPEAIAAFRRVVAAEPYNATAVYGLATALLRGGADAEGREAMDRFERLQSSTYAVTYSQAYLEQGRYAEAIASTGAETNLVDPRIPDVTFADAASLVAGGGSTGAGSVTLVDLDGDGDLDLVEGTAGSLRMFDNDRGAFTDVTAERLGPLARVSSGASSPDALPPLVVGGDYDNDGRLDLAVLGSTGLRLLRGTSGMTFVDVTEASGMTSPPGGARSAAWVDVDHDADLDLAVAFGVSTGGAFRLFRNNGNGSFTDITAAARLATSRSVRAIVPMDFDNRRDIDLLLVTDTGVPMLFRNLRDGTFSDVAASVGLAATATGPLAPAAVGDINKDGFVDLFLPQAGGSTLAVSDGRGRFVTSPGPEGSADTRASQFVDYDNDGLLDLLVLTGQGPRLFRSIGAGWSDVTPRALPSAMTAALATATSLATGDLDGDGDTDVVARGAPGPTVWRNDGGSRARSLRVSLRPRVSNGTAVGSRVELRAGSLRHQLVTYAAAPAPAPADLLFGLGTRAGADVVRVLWPSGILQAETGGGSLPVGAPIAPGTPPLPTPLTGTLTIEELNRKPSSCPYLFTWNGERFEFISDFLGGGEMGYWLAPGQRNTPDPDEYVRISGDRLRPRDGRYELRITNELEEVLFLDRAELVAVDHPADVEVHPHEGLGASPQPFRLSTFQGAAPPLEARDSTGRDVLDTVARVDRRYVADMPLERVRGYAVPHTLTLRLPAPGPGGRRTLLLTGWTDYAFSNDNVAAFQARLSLLPPSLETREADGTWRTVIEDIGVPVGRPQTVVVDLADRVPASVREVRIRTSMRIYWDQVLVDTSEGRAPYTIARLEPATALLQWRGYSAEAPPDGREPMTYDYARVTREARWKLMPGRYTREGDVRDLLTGVDDMFVVSRTGDEIALSFDAKALPALPAGWTRTFLLYANGFSKEMNLHSASPDEVAPLPFHGMKRYPYTAPEAYPSTPAHREYLARYNTRTVPRPLPSLDAHLQR